MKFSAIILFFIYSFSLVSPLFTIAQTPPPTTTYKKTCCKSMSKKCPENKQQKEDPCKGCMSVLTCPQCIYTVPDHSTTPSAPQAVKPVNKKAITNFSLSTYSDETWHPPEFFQHI